MHPVDRICSGYSIIFNNKSRVASPSALSKTRIISPLYTDMASVLKVIRSNVKPSHLRIVTTHLPVVSVCKTVNACNIMTEESL